MAKANEIRKDGPPEGRATKCPVDPWLVRGRIHSLMNAPGTGVGIRLSLAAELQRRDRIKEIRKNSRLRAAVSFGEGERDSRL